LPLLAATAMVLFHDSHHPPVRAGIDDMIARCGGELVDLGELSLEQTELHSADGTEIWGGLRAARFVRGRSAASGAPPDSPLDETTRSAMNTIIRRSAEKVSELEQANARIWSDLQDMRAAFDDRGRRVLELDARLAELWKEHQTGTGNYENELARLLREQSALVEGFEERGKRVIELEESNRKLCDELRRLGTEVEARGRRIQQTERRWPWSRWTAGKGR
jgi:hypothetical protein